MDGDGELTPAMVFSFYKTRLTEVLTKHNPAGLNTIGSLLKQFPGKEHQVYVQICKKCGVAPVQPPTSADFHNGIPKPNNEVADDRVKQWLMKNNFVKYAMQHQFMMMSWESFISINTKGRLIELGVIPRQAQELLDAIKAATAPAGAGGAQPGSGPSPVKSDFEVGENCFTQVVTKNAKEERFLKARVTHVNDDNTYDIFVYNSKAHGVPPEAVNVPREMLKKSTEKVQVAVPDNKRAAKRPQFQQGDRVRVFGLRSHTSYNGLCGTVLLYVPSERRYQVRLDTNDVIAIKQRNVAPENGDAPKDTSSDASKKKKNKGGSKTDEAALSELMTKLMQDNPDADPGKLGEFAAGYLLAKQKLNSSDG